MVGNPSTIFFQNVTDAITLKESFGVRLTSEEALPSLAAGGGSQT